MKKIFGILAIVAATLSLTGCGVSMMTSENYNQTKVVLSENNFKVVGIAKGEWSATYVFGIGGFSSNSLMNNAISDMYEKANLTGSQTIINVTTAVSVKQIVWGIYLQRTAVVTGTIIEFTE